MSPKFTSLRLWSSLTSQLIPSSPQDSVKACADPAAFAYGMQEKQAENSTSPGPFFLFSEPIRNFSHTSALGEGELNKSLLDRVTFRLQCQYFWKWWGTKRVVRASDSSCFPVLDIGLKMTCLCGSSWFYFFATERHHIVVLFLLFRLSQWV